MYLMNCNINLLLIRPANSLLSDLHRIVRIGMALEQLTKEWHTMHYFNVIYNKSSMLDCCFTRVIEFAGGFTGITAMAGSPVPSINGHSEA